MKFLSLFSGIGEFDLGHYQTLVLSIRAENIAQQAVRKFRTLFKWDDERTEAFRRRIMEVVQEFMA